MPGIRITHETFRFCCCRCCYRCCTYLMNEYGYIRSIESSYISFAHALCTCIHIRSDRYLLIIMDGFTRMYTQMWFHVSFVHVCTNSSVPNHPR